MIAAGGRPVFRVCAATDGHADYLRKNLDSMLERADELGAFHGKVAGLMKGKSDDVVRLGELLPHYRLQANPYVCDFLWPEKIADVLSIQLYHSKGGAVVLCMGMPEGEVTATQLGWLHFIRQHIRLAADKLSRMASFTNLTGTLRLLWQQGRAVGISVVSPDGGKLWECDAVSVATLNELGGSTDSKTGATLMPGVLESWIKPLLFEHTRVCARTDEYARHFQTGNGTTVRASLLIERAGSGALLVLKRDKKNGDYGGLFTRRERDVIACISQGMCSQETADQLRISKRTVDKHLENIYTKLGARNRVMALKRLEEM